MKVLDWAVLVVTLTSIIIYGVYKSRTTKNLDGYFLSNRNMPWYTILLSIMGTQASAVTFLAAPGQAFTDGMRFVQYYFGLPLAAIILCISFVPVFSRLKIYTAYEYLQNRFDSKTRGLASFLFLLQRGLSTGISVYAPSIVLSILLGWNIYFTNLLMGGLLIIYTVSGGAKAVAQTQQVQFIIIILTMIFAGYFIIQKLPSGISFTDALHIGGKTGKFNIITTGFTNGKFDWGDRYNIFSGVIGGFFLLLSYFGTDQSQVGRYLTAKNITQSRLGLLMNGIIKIPMQFFILLIGVLMFAFYQFHKAPAFFNSRELQRLENSVYKNELEQLTNNLNDIKQQKKVLLDAYIKNKTNNALYGMDTLQQQELRVRKGVKELVEKNNGDDNDTNYIFMHFVIDYLPVGLIGFIIAVIFLASWGSIAAAVNSLASSTIIDFHKPYFRKNQSEAADYKYSKIYTFFWGAFCVLVAMFVAMWDNSSSLIEIVNVLGSLFYGTILGIFLVALYAKQVKGNAVFYAALVTEALVILLFILNEKGIIGLGFLWLNAIGAIMVFIVALLLQKTVFKKEVRIT